MTVPTAAYAVVENGKIIPATTYETRGMAKYHWLVFKSGDYDPDDFHLTGEMLDWNKEFEKYPQAIVVPVQIQKTEGQSDG